MNSSKVFAISAGLTLAATLLVSPSSAAATSTHPLPNRSSMSQGSSSISTTAQHRTIDRDSKTDRLVAAGGNKPCQLYYGCVPPPTPPPTGGGGGADNPKGHQFAPETRSAQIAQVKQPKDDRGHDPADHDKNDDHGIHGAGHRFAPTAA